MRLAQEFARKVHGITAALTALAQFDVRNHDSLTVQLKNTGAAALDQFEVRGRAVPGGAPQNAHVPLQSSGFLQASPVVPWVSSDPVTLAAGASCLVVIYAADLESIEIAAAGADVTTLELSAAGFAE